MLLVPTGLITKERKTNVIYVKHGGYCTMQNFTQWRYTCTVQKLILQYLEQIFTHWLEVSAYLIGEKISYPFC